MWIWTKIKMYWACMYIYLRRGDTKGSPSAGECGGKPQPGYDRWMGERARGVREAKNHFLVQRLQCLFLENMF